MPTRGEARSERPVRGGAPSASSKSGRPNGWAAVAKKQQEYESRKERSEDEKNKPRDFWMKTGETAVIQILHDEPFTFDGHSIRNGDGDWVFEPCQLAIQKHCLMCRDGIKQGWRGAFKILDYRGTWDKDKKDFKWDEPIEKVWVVNMTILGLLANQKEKRKKPLSQLVLEVSKTGSGTSTSYNFETAYDEKDNKMEPIDWDEKFPHISECVAPKTDELLLEIGFEEVKDEGKKR